MEVCEEVQGVVVGDCWSMAAWCYDGSGFERGWASLAVAEQWKRQQNVVDHMTGVR